MRTDPWRMTGADRIISAIVLVCFSLVSGLGGCCLWSKPYEPYDDLPTSVQYSSGLVELKTDTGRTATIVSDNFGCTFRVEVSPQGGSLSNPYVINYAEVGESVIISGRDPENRYSPFSISGTPDDLYNQQSKGPQNGRFLLIGGTIVLIFAVAAITLASIKFVVSVGKMQLSTARNIVGVHDGKPLLHISIREFVEVHLAGKVKAATALASITLTLIAAPLTAAAATQATLPVVFNSAEDFVVNEAVGLVTDKLSDMASAIGAERAEGIIGETMVWVVLDYEASDNSLEKIFCGYTLYLDDPSGLVPSIPTGGSANWVDSNSAVSVTWDSLTDIGGYLVYRQNAKGYYERLNETTNAYYKDTDVSSSNSYSYKVRSYKTDGVRSGYSSAMTTPGGIPVDGLVAYYPFNGNADDESANGNHGTVNDATPITDRLGNTNSAYSFDGVNDYIRVPDNDALDITLNFSVSFFIKTITSRTGYFLTKHKASTDWDGSWFLELQPSNIIMFESTPYSDYSVVSGPTTLSSWSHVVFAFDHTTDVWTSYVDGVLTATGTRAFMIKNTSLDLIIGAHMNSSGNVYNFFQGNLDDLRIYNRALTEAEVQALYYEGGWTGSS